MSTRRSSLRPFFATVPRGKRLACSDTASGGFTLVEVLVTLTLTLILLTAVVKVFSGVGDGISKSKKVLETFDRLRLTEALLREDLAGVTVSTEPPWRADENKGYFEYIENGLSYDPPAVILDPTDPRSQYPAVTSANANNPPMPKNNGDSTVGQRGDILMFTTRSRTRPFIGRCQAYNTVSNPYVQSDVAEVAWFLRGRTLHRRLLLVAPGLNNSNAQYYYPPLMKTGPLPLYTFQGYPPGYFYHDFDVSVHRALNSAGTPIFVANSLADLAHRENRFGHPSTTFPFDVRSQWGLLGLPTLRECADTGYMNGLTWNSGSFPNVPVGPTKNTYKQFDLWQNFCYDSGSKTQYWLPDWYLNLGPTVTQPTTYTARDADDIVLTNVIGFDVKAWDPPVNPPQTAPTNPAVNTGGYFDLGNGSNHFKSNNVQIPAYSSTMYSGITPLSQVYDTFPTSHESDGIYQYKADGTLQVLTQGGQSNNGFDDGLVINGQTHYNGMVDGPNDYLTSPPYPNPLRGIQIKIRVFEPSSRQIREVTIEHDFVPK